VFLTRIRRQVEQFQRAVVVAADEFVLPGADGPAGAVGAVEGVVRVMEVERVALERLAFQQRAKRRPVERLTVVELAARGVQRGESISAVMSGSWGTASSSPEYWRGRRNR